MHVHWCPEGNARVASASTDWSVRVWDLELNQCTHILDGHGGTVNALSWSFDGRRIGSGSSDHTVTVSIVINCVANVMEDAAKVIS